MRIGIYGGTFDPPHLGHMAAAVGGTRALELDRLLLIPDGQPPHKELSPSSAPAEDRLAMTRIAADRLGLKIPVEVLDLELRRQGRSYTSDTLLEISARYPHDELWLLMGRDMFDTFADWHGPDIIVRLASILAFGRTQKDTASDLEARKARLTEQLPSAHIRTMTLPELVEISSSALREKLNSGQGRDYLDESVWGYILLHRLYGVERDLTRLNWDDLRAASRSMVRAKRLPHIRGIEEEAVRLARRWGANEDDARTAAILHDCTKYFSLREQLSLCKKYGILLDEMERGSEKLLHSKTGAAIARHVFGVNDAVYDAIYSHTTGRADMTLLEKIIYIADYMEPSRDFPGVEQLRALAQYDLDGAVLLGLEMTEKEMAERHQPLHPRSVEAADWLRTHRYAE